MGLSVSVLLSAWKEISAKASILLFGIRRSSPSELLKSSCSNEGQEGFETHSVNSTPGKHVCKDGMDAVGQCTQIPVACIYEENSESAKMNMISPRPVRELDAAATTVQKFYRSYRTRRNLADCAVVIQELWWKALDSASLKQSSVTYFDIEKQETAGSRWSRAKTRAAKVGQGLSKDEKARKLTLQHWLEAIDPRHRYGHNLHFYYAKWSDSKSAQPFFYWLDIGDGKELNIQSCPRSNLQHQCISYLGPLERKSYEVTVEDRKLVYKQDGELVNTEDGSKWIFVLSTSRQLYVGRKRKGIFQHSSFLSGGATKAAGRLVACDGVLEAIWPYSGHYLPTLDNFKEFLLYLEEHNVDLTSVELGSSLHENNASFSMYKWSDSIASTKSSLDADISSECSKPEQNMEANDSSITVKSMSLRTAARAVSWTGGTGARISYVKDQPANFQLRAFEKVNIFPELALGSPVSTSRALFA